MVPTTLLSSKQKKFYEIARGFSVSYKKKDPCDMGQECKQDIEIQDKPEREIQDRRKREIRDLPEREIQEQPEREQLAPEQHP